MPMFIYHYMILNIIVNGLARGRANGVPSLYMLQLVTAAAPPGVFFARAKTFLAARASLWMEGVRERRFFFSELGRIQGRDSLR